jgi:hypothetical protein
MYVLFLLRALFFQSCLTIEGSASVRVRPPSSSAAYKSSGGRAEHVFTFRFVFALQISTHCFSRVFSPTSTQAEVYETMCAPLVDDVMANGNALVFAYGVTNSGKTHTIQGIAAIFSFQIYFVPGSNADLGILPRCVMAIFNRIGDRRMTEPMFRPSMTNTISQLNVQQQRDEVRRRHELVTCSGASLVGFFKCYFVIYYFFSERTTISRLLCH